MKLLDKLNRLLPICMLPPLIIEVIWNFIVYGGVRFINIGRHHYIMELSIDSIFPVIYSSIIIYFGCYLFWVANYIIGCRQDTKEAMRFLSADFLGKLICLIIFIAVPTTNVRPEITDTGLFAKLLNLLYSIDAPDNLFPSIHCLTSWYCFIAVRKNKNVPTWYKITSFIIAILIFLSTLTTRQHVIVDVFAGALIAEISYQVVERISFTKLYTNIISKIPICRELNSRS